MKKIFFSVKVFNAEFWYPALQLLSTKCYFVVTFQSFNLAFSFLVTIFNIHTIYNICHYYKKDKNKDNLVESQSRNTAAHFKV